VPLRGASAKGSGYLLLKRVVFGLHLHEARWAFGFFADLQSGEVDGVLENQLGAAETASVLVLDDRLMLFFMAGVVFPLIHFPRSQLLLALRCAGGGP